MSQAPLPRAAAVAIISRAYNSYRRRKSANNLRQEAPWLFTWASPGNLDIDEVQKWINDRHIQESICRFMELLGSDKTSSLCHSKMILMAFMLTKCPDLLCGDNPDTTASSNSMAEDYEMVELARILGGHFVNVCDHCDDWISRLRFADAYSAMSKQFLTWKKNDAQEIIKKSLEKLSSCIIRCDEIKKGIAAGDIDAKNNTNRLKLFKMQSQYHYVMILKVVGSARKTKQLVSCHMLKVRFFQQLTKTMGGAKQLTATEWVEADDELSTTKLRMALMMRRLGMEAKAPRYGSRIVEYDEEIVQIWCGKFHEIESNTMNTILNECENTFSPQHQIMWVPAFLDYVLCVFKTITAPQNKELQEEYSSLDMDFALQECEMNCFGVRKLIDWIVCVLKRLSLGQNRSDRLKRVSEVYEFLQQGNFREAILLLMSTIMELRMDYCDVTVNRFASNVEQTNREAKEKKEKPSNELILFIRDFLREQSHVVKLSRWLRAIPSTEDHLLNKDKYYLLYYNYVEYLLGPFNLKDLPETMEMLRIPIVNAKLMLEDIIRGFAMLQFVVGVSGDGGCISRLKKQILNLLATPGLRDNDSLILDKLMDSIEQERPGMTTAELKLLRGLLTKCLDRNDDVVSLARARMKKTLLAAFQSNTDEIKAIKGHLDLFSCEVHKAVKLCLGIWNLSLETYEPIYKSMIALRNTGTLASMDGRLERRGRVVVDNCDSMTSMEVDG